MRHRSYFPRDEAPTVSGSLGLAGWNATLSPEQLPPQLVAYARNVRRTERGLGTRKGVVKCLWGQRIQESGGLRWPLRWADAHALDRFRDPNGLEWMLLGAEDRVWRLRPNNQPVAIAQPATVWFGPPLTFVQAFGRVYCLRGNHRRSLVMTAIDAGWSYVWPTWDATVDYPTTATVMWGPWTAEASTALTVSGATATLATTAAHGLLDGSEISIRSGTLPAVYQGTFRVTVLDGRTVTFRHTGDGTASPAHALEWTVHKAGWKVVTGQDPAVGEEPGVSAKWTRDYSVLPNGQNGVFLNGRLLVPTSWVPGASSTEAADYGPKTDYVAASDVSNQGRFTIANEFRINQGSADELMALAKGSPRDVVCFKSATLLALRNLSGDLSALTLETLRSPYGVVNPRAMTAVGRDLAFVAPHRGVVTLTQTINGEVTGVDVPLSEPIRPVIRRIQWSKADKIRLAYWDNKLFVAVPLDEGIALGASQLPRMTVPTTVSSVAEYLTPGTEYEWQPGANDSLEVNGEVLEASHGNQRFTYDGGAALLWYAGPYTEEDYYFTESKIRPVYHGVNNALLVFDYTAPVVPGDDPGWRSFHPVGQWISLDDGPDLSVREFVVATVHGRERLLALTADGWLSLLEESDNGDCSRPDEPWHNLAVVEPIETVIGSRGFSEPGKVSRAVRTLLDLATWSPKYSIAVKADGVKEEKPVRSNVTRDRTKFVRPAWAPRFNPFAAGADHDAPWREDYSVVPDLEITADMLEPTADDESITADYAAIGLDVARTGLVADRLQEHPEQIPLPSLPGRWQQIWITNRDGRMEIRAIAIEQITTSRQDKTKV